MVQVTKIPESIFRKIVDNYDALICVASEYGANIAHRSESRIGDVVYSTFYKHDDRKRVLDTSKDYGAYLPIGNAVNVGYGSKLSLARNK